MDTEWVRQGDRDIGTHNSKYSISNICLTEGFRELMEKEAEKTVRTVRDGGHQQKRSFMPAEKRSLT